MSVSCESYHSFLLFTDYLLERGTKIVKAPEDTTSYLRGTGYENGIYVIIVYTSEWICREICYKSLVYQQENVYFYAREVCVCVSERDKNNLLICK
nr:MAG TPA: hypothetical protein [Caudoviricetes sp.]